MVFREPYSIRGGQSGPCPYPGRVYLHAYLPGFKCGELDTTALEPLRFKGVKPRLDVNQGHRGPSYWTQAKWHGHYFTWCPEKAGSLFWKTSVTPWVDYAPDAWWVTRLWKAHKVNHEGYLVCWRLLGEHA